MKFPKPYYALILTLLAASLTLYSCKDFNDLDLESPSGEADFTSIVAIGNSLTAGYQHAALYETGQKYSFPALVAGQTGVAQDFEQPMISSPGISLQNGRLGLDGSTLSDPTPAEGQGQPINSDLDRPYNNLGIPGALVADFIGQDLGPNNTYQGRRDSNPFFEIVLRDQGNTQAEQMAAMQPTFVMFWLGNNEVLGYVTSGGNTPYVPSSSFQQLYGGAMQAISQTGADVILYNVPNVTSIPYVFLVNAQLLQNGTITINESNNFALVTPQGDIPIWVETTDPDNPGVVQDTVQMRAPNPQAGQPGGFFILPASSQLSSLFQNGVGTQSSNPIPHSLVLDNGEALKAIQLISEYNLAISSLASSNGFTLVDINSTFTQIVQNFRTDGSGITMNGVTLRPVPGELFSLDGVHPGNQGHGVVANLTIDAINEAYNANLQNIDISEIPEGIPINN